LRKRRGETLRRVGFEKRTHQGVGTDRVGGLQNYNHQSLTTSGEKKTGLGTPIHSEENASKPPAKRFRKELSWDGMDLAWAPSVNCHTGEVVLSRARPVQKPGVRLGGGVGKVCRRTRTQEQSLRERGEGRQT